MPPAGIILLKKSTAVLQHCPRIRHLLILTTLMVNTEDYGKVMFMMETTIVEKEKMKKLRKPVMIVGLPGIGLIGQVVGRYADRNSLIGGPSCGPFDLHLPHRF